ncbi:hypothetical protein Q4E93_07125 [Flavitalea sp. BT771]|uniref:hypothetical protein n=1 Tax=Flavitalea sp. BT771 TaxID=3063329 RepID=UPI0026E20446|nr:hypothetical protein [Flavitalea sp. BT771]MDO6430350.1 hypothetical protein [Flavitalea sp. BT771]MDV6219510.1 hypothetical protein [Flavitalea sp. BT771]
MGPPKTPWSNALFGIFLQDICAIRHKHPRTFGGKYYRFDYAVMEGGGYCLSIEPDDLSKTVKREITQAFDKRLNQGTSSVAGAGMNGGLGARV